MEIERGEMYVVGVGSARPAPDRADVNTTELSWEAVFAALEDAGVELREISGAVTASQDFWEGRTISSMAINEVVGGTLGSEAKVAADGTMALLYASARIEDGDQRLNLVLAHSKESQADPVAIGRAAFDPFYHRPLGPDETVAAALQARAFYRTAGFGPEDAARVVAAARRRSSHLEPIDADDVLSSPSSSDPLRELDQAPLMDSAVALVVCDGETAERIGGSPVRVVAGAARSGPLWLDAELDSAPAFGSAVREALDSADWALDSVERIEITAPFAHQLLLLAGELGIAAGGELLALFEATEGGTLLNPSGGWHAGSSGTVAGLAAAADATLALRGTPRRALVHGSTGICCQSHAVVLLEGVA